MVDGPLVGAGAGGKAEHHAISLRKVGVLIGVYGSTVTYQKHLCSSQHFPGSKNDPKCIALYSSPSPRRPLRLSRRGTGVFQTLTQTHSSLLQHTWPLWKFSSLFFFPRDELISVCTQTGMRLSDHYNSEKKEREKRITYLHLQNESVQFLSVG